jgi:hypothetical protein
MTRSPSNKIARKWEVLNLDRDISPVKEEGAQDGRVDISLQRYKESLREYLIAQKNQDRWNQVIFVKVLLWAFIGQIISMNLLAYAVACGKFTLTNIQFACFFVSVFGEITILMAFMIKYLFPAYRHIYDETLLKGD